jgi:glucose/arabinose dehydrogenase
MNDESASLSKEKGPTPMTSRTEHASSALVSGPPSAVAKCIQLNSPGGSKLRILLVRLGHLGAILACASAARAQTLQATLVQSGFLNPVFVCSPPGDLQRLFVVEQSGRIKIIENGATLATPFLDLGSGGLDKIVAGGEQGLLGLAFHPNFAVNGYFYVDYTRKGSSALVIERYKVGANPDVALPSSGHGLLSITHYTTGHNGGCIQFGLDGKLYVGTGDAETSINSQSHDLLLGKMLRLDIDLPPPYVPPDNPFVGSTTLPEIWHLGLRNPWRFSFDRATGDLWIGDVGDSTKEEIDFIPPAVAPLNLGWPCIEGTTCMGWPCSCTSSTFTSPIHEYDNGLPGCAIIGGYVYRGSAICGLGGAYIFGDFCSTSIWSLRYVNGQVLNLTDRTVELEPAGSPTIDRISSFGEDAAGELYICDIFDGEIYRIEASVSGVDCNANGIPDTCDIVNGTLRDCNANLVADTCEIVNGSVPDCNANLVPDTCEIVNGSVPDCNANQVPDSCDIVNGTAPDCNANQVPDSCDIANGSALDINSNGVPDECDCPLGIPPMSYCTAKLNSQFCLPTIDFSGYPSASGATPFAVTAVQVLNNMSGFLFYGYQSAVLPFQGGVLCVQSPLRRTPAQNSHGSPSGVDCSGVFSLDFGAWIASGVDPVLQPGQDFRCQYWSRDPQDPCGSSTTDAVWARVCR